MIATSRATEREARRGRATVRGRSRPRSSCGPTIGPACRLARLATGFALTLRRAILGHDAIDPPPPGLLRYQRQAEPLAHHRGQEAADRVRLPAGRLHDHCDGYALPGL